MRHLAAALIVPLLWACGDAPHDPDQSPTESEAQGDLRCQIPTEFIRDGGVGREGIPALTAPETAAPGDPGTGYLEPDHRVVGLQLGDRTIAVPHSILWWHEVVNLEAGDVKIAVTYCPLTGSSLVFDRAAVDGEEFIVSGLLFFNNLIMTTREEGTSLYPQMSRAARCGPRRGTRLPTLPALEITWQAWRELHPDTEVLTSDTGHDRPYGTNPYREYGQIGNPRGVTAVPDPDDRRPPKERVIGIPAGNIGGIAVPFGELEDAGEAVAHRVGVVPGGGILLWRTSAGGGRVYRRTARDLPAGSGLEDTDLSFEVRGGQFYDRQTGTRWRLDGAAVEGPLAGARLEPFPQPFVAYWFAWAVFQPETEILELAN